MRRQWNATRADPRFFYQASADPQLVYELRSGYTYDSPDHRRLHINGFGIRDDDESLPTAPRKIAVLGDSVAFSVGADQCQTLPARLQEAMDPSAKRVKVLNFGVAGYSANEVAEFLKNKNAVYRVSDVVYVMNPNDFARRDTRFEGADDALYRIHHPPLLATPMLVRKAIYRWHKSRAFSASGTSLVRPEWYLWMFGGTRDYTFDAIRRMRRYASENGIRFGVVLVPMRSAYTPDGGYALARMSEAIADFFRIEGLPFLDPHNQFASDPAKYLTESDHLEAPGMEKMAEVLRDILVAMAAVPPASQPVTTQTVVKQTGVP